MSNELIDRGGVKGVVGGAGKRDELPSSHRIEVPARTKFDPLYVVIEHQDMIFKGWPWDILPVEDGTSSPDMSQYCI